MENDWSSLLRPAPERRPRRAEVFGKSIVHNGLTATRWRGADAAARGLWHSTHAKFGRGGVCGVGGRCHHSDDCPDKIGFISRRVVAPPEPPPPQAPPADPTTENGGSGDYLSFPLSGGRGGGQPKPRSTTPTHAHVQSAAGPLSEVDKERRRAAPAPTVVRKRRYRLTTTVVQQN